MNLVSTKRVKTVFSSKWCIFIYIMVPLLNANVIFVNNNGTLPLMEINAESELDSVIKMLINTNSSPDFVFCNTRLLSDELDDSEDDVIGLGVGDCDCDGDDVGDGEPAEYPTVLGLIVVVCGDFVGFVVGYCVGGCIGDIVGNTVGDVVGDIVGNLVGSFVVGGAIGDIVGGIVGNIVGDIDGNIVGNFVGTFVVGDIVGNNVGPFIGDCVAGCCVVDDIWGDNVGKKVGFVVSGDNVGSFIGRGVVGDLGCRVGRGVRDDGICGVVGCGVGDDVGVLVGFEKIVGLNDNCGDAAGNRVDVAVYGAVVVGSFVGDCIGAVVADMFVDWYDI